jgi:hypothetical protein
MSQTPQDIFDSAYQTSLAPQVAALASIPDLTARSNAAATLATQGFIVDVPINVWGWDPFLVMTYRMNYGYTWVPSALQPNISVAPGVSQPGTVPYDPAHPPAGSIKVSTNPADYPPYNPPAPTPSPVISSDPVGPLSVGNIYLTVVGDSSPIGTEWTDARGTFVKLGAPTPFGVSAYWRKIT